MGILQFPISRNSYLSLLDDEITIHEFLSDIFWARVENMEDNSNSMLICNELLHNHQGDGGAPEVNDFEFEPEDCSFDSKTKTGSVVLRYSVYHYYGCSDMDSSNETYETATFEINVKERFIELNIPEAVQRDTFEEF